MATSLEDLLSQEIDSPPTVVSPEREQVVVSATSAVGMAQAGKLLPVDQVLNSVSSTEPISFVNLTDNSTAFRFSPDWNSDLREIGSSEKVEAFVTVAGREYQFTKEGIQAAASTIGLTSAYISKAPPSLIEPHFNYWYAEGLGGKKQNLFVTNGDTASAVTKASIEPFSNVRLLEEAVSVINSKYPGSSILVDKKFTHTLNSTFLRLVIPDVIQIIDGTSVEEDAWSIGVQFKNSLTGKFQTEISGYLFRWWCANGAVDTMFSSGGWSRKQGGQGDAVYEWATDCFEQTLNGITESLAKIQHTTSQDVTSQVTDILRDIFSNNKIPVSLRDSVMNELVNLDSISNYDLMNAVTSVANTPGLDPFHVDSLMRIGGDIGLVDHSRCGSCHRSL